MILSSKSGSLESTEPVDRYNLIYALIFFLGLSGHLPWNAVLTAQPYFKLRLSGSSLASEFTAHFAIIFKAIKLIVFTVVSVAGLKINNKLWVGGAAMGNLIVFAVFTGMVQEKVNGIGINSFYLITLILVVAAGSFLAMFECGMYSILGTFPSHLTQSFMAGNAIGGILAALNLIYNYYSASSNIYASTKAYFAEATIVFLLTAILFIVFLCTDYFKFYQKKLALYTVVAPNGTNKLFDEHQSNSTDTFNLLGKPVESDEIHETPSLLQRILGDSTELIKKLWSPNLALFIVGFVNLTIFPALVSVTESTSATKTDVGAFKKDLFVPLAFLVVSSADFIVKMIPSIKIVRQYDQLPFPAMSLARLMLIPLFLLGNVRINGKSLVFPAFLASDYLFFSLLMVAFISGSYISTILTISAPKKLDISERSRATVLLCSSTQLGVFVGSLFSLFLKLFLRLFTK